MTSIKRLRSVIQSTAHHAVSGLCYIHPHLGEECKKEGLKKITLNLLKPEFTPKLTSVTNELELSTNVLREKFRELLLVENIQVSDIENAIIVFDFRRGKWPTSSYIEAVTVEGKKAEVAVDSSGNTAEVLRVRS